MRANLFWFNDEQWARIEPLIPSNRRGVKPKNNRRILSGIMHVLKTGCRWVDCPPEYGPAKTVYNRFNRWSAQGIWQSIFEAAAEPGPGDVFLLTMPLPQWLHFLDPVLPAPSAVAAYGQARREGIESAPITQLGPRHLKAPCAYRSMTMVPQGRPMCR